MPDPLDIQPQDELNRNWLGWVHPPDWANPKSASRYNLVVIGAGTAGLVTAAGAAGLGARVALVERHLMGGDCLNIGCVPSKTLIRSARAAAAMREGARFGVGLTGEVQVDFAAVMERVRAIRSRIARHDSVERFRSLGVDVFLGDARFADSETVEVAGQRLRYKSVVIATGARPVVPTIPGLAEAGFLTNETVFNLTERPLRLAVIGAGPIGCELAQTFQRLGCRVALFHLGDHILDREDADAADVVQRRFLREGVQLVLKAAIHRVERSSDGKKIVYSAEGKTDTVIVDAILVAAGRTPNLEGLNLDGVGVQYDAKGIHVDDTLRTTCPRIYAAGDVCLPYQFTHVADFAARIVIENALFNIPLKRQAKLSALIVPWCTYTEPEIAHVGLYEHQARERGMEVDTYLRHLSEVDRAITDGEEEGFVKIHVTKGTDRIVGATIVAGHAGDMISEITLAMKSKMGLASLASVIHPYPTQAEAIRQLGDAFKRTKLTPTVKRLFERWMAWTR